MTLRDKILAAALFAVADFATTTARAVNDQNTDNPHTPEPDTTAEETTEPEPCDAPAVTARTWRAAFASDIAAGDLIAIDGRHFGAPPGRRAIRITDRRDGEHQHNPFTAPTAGITFLFVDLDTGRSASISTAPDACVDLAVQIPDSVPADLETPR